MAWRRYAEMRPHRERELVLAAAHLAAINRTARAQGATPFVALATVLLLWLRALTGKTDLSLMVTRQGRTDAAAQVSSPRHKYPGQNSDLT